MCNYRMDGTAHDAGRYCKCGGAMELVAKLRYMVGVDFSHHADATTYAFKADHEQAAQRASAAMGVPAEMLGVPLEPQRPTYRIRAREVVPGMRLANDVLVLETGRLCDRRDPSPRELACTCWEDCLHHGDEYRWEDEAILQRGAECAEYAQRRAELATEHPGDHAPDCPVAPVQGRHGGMRLWPAPFRGMPWEWTGWAWQRARSKWRCVTDANGVVAAVHGMHDPEALNDAIVQCFYLPPEPQPEREAPSWDPYGTDLDLAVRYG
jgi:hypothetical protein